MSVREITLPPGARVRHRFDNQSERHTDPPRPFAWRPEEPLPTLVSGDIALTSTIARDGAGVRAQVARRQADGTWLRLLDQPEIGPPVQR